MTRSSIPSVRSGAVTVRDLFAASLIAADPTAFTARAIRLRLPADRGPARPIWIIALGKAAFTMARAAVHELAERNATIAGGLIVGPHDADSPHPRLKTFSGDHPLPGERSFAAAAALGALCDQVPGGDRVFVLLSGGASSLIAAPVEGIASTDLIALCDTLLHSGLDIGRVNAIRKRFLRWGAGRLAEQLAPARIELIVLSDVIGDDLANIASGPCVPDASTAVDVRVLLDDTALADRTPRALLRYLDEVMRGERLETPKSDAPAFLFAGVPAVQGNGGVLDAGALRARVLGFEPVVIVNEPLVGEAALAGERVAAAAMALPRGGVALWGGETTVTMSPGKGTGGRCQEMMLAAAIALANAGRGASGITLLGAGTDGRDGPTDAAGAIVDSTTVARIMEAGMDPAVALHRHDSHEPLHRAGALLKTGLTGTNVGDVVIAVRM
ncbi:MAG: glycerate kinase type-2 family protein [Gemmatimonadaceae bacterium]